MSSSRTALISAAAVLAPTVLLLTLPFVRKPTPRPKRAPVVLPEGVSRIFTPDGLEVFVGKGKEASDKQAPILCLHGGFGTALCYSRWLPYFAERGRTAYSLSLSGHGESPRPSDFTTRTVSGFASELSAALGYIRSLHPDAPEPILVGHSAGGGLSQYTLDRGLAQTSAVVLLAPFPCTGGWPVYINWARQDALFGIRMLLHGGDPRSPLSSPSLVKGVFFGPSLPDSAVDSFYKNMNHEESISWPSSMLLRFADARKVEAAASGRVLLVGGEKDVLMSPRVMRGLGKEYGCKLVLIPGAGHHMMHDTPWKDAADVVLGQIEQWGL